MNQTLVTLSNGPLHWNPSFPPSFKGLGFPGATPAHAAGNFGTLTIQEYNTHQYALRLNVFDLLQRLIIRSITNQKGIFARVILKGHCDHTLQKQLNWSLRQNQFALLHADHPEIIEQYEKKLHISFDTFFSQELIDEMIPLFPALEKSLLQSPALLHFPRKAGDETLDIVHSILRCRYEKRFIRKTFDNRVRDLLLNLLIESVEENNAVRPPTPKETQAIYDAEKIITDDLAKHFHIPQLAKRVLLNQYSLKIYFKLIFGVGPYEYLTRKRFEKAKELLQQGLSVKEVAGRFGYRPSHFTTSFSQTFGYTPSSIKKNKPI